jgi:hypothetical protein
MPIGIGSFDMYGLSHGAVPCPALQSFDQDVNFLFGDVQYDLEDWACGFGLPQLNSTDVSAIHIGHLTPQRDPACMGYEAFKRSPWIWNPDRRENVSAEQAALTQSEGQAATLSGAGQTFIPHVVQDLDHDSRDRIFRMVLATCRSPMSISSFLIRNCSQPPHAGVFRSPAS